MTSLIEQTRCYLNFYLEDFAEKGRSEDPIYKRPYPGSVPFSMQHIPLKINQQETLLQELMRQVPKASLQDFRNAVISKACKPEGFRTLVLDIASMWYGTDFGIQVARGNKDAEVRIYNPLTHVQDMNGKLYEPKKADRFPEFFFNDVDPDRIPKFETEVPFDHKNAEDSAKRLYRANGLDNIWYHQEAISQKTLERIMRSNPDRQIIIFSDRTPTYPKELGHQIATVVAEHENADMILAPFFNDEIRAYQDDPMIQLMNKHRTKIEKCTDDTPFMDQVESRLFVAAQLYYCLKIAENTGAQVYQKTGLKCPSCNPSHYVSTIVPKGA